jgi:putative ABC transport system permease protein
MLRNYLKTTFRFLLKNKTFTVINITGLAVGTLCCLYIVLYVKDQFGYDKYFSDAKDIYRITTSLSITGDKHNNATASPPIAPAMKNDFPEVEQFTRVVPTIGVEGHLLRYKDKSIYEKDVVFVDSTFFDVFNFNFINGNEKNALVQPYTVVLLKSVADKLFGREDPVNQVIEIDNAYGNHDFKVTGVVDESKGKSHIHASMFITMNSGSLGDYVRSNTMWAGNNFTDSYVKLYPNSNAAALEKKLPAFLNKYGAQQLKSLGMVKVLHLQPINSIHTTTGYENETSKPVSSTFLYILLLIAGLIQIIACINFMNLATARASNRAKEVGVRKVIGADRSSLIKQFLGESFLLTIISVLLALPLLMLALPYLNQITGSDIQLSFVKNYWIWLVLVCIVIITGLLAGSYPAFYLSAFDAIKVVKGNFTNRISAAGIRRSLVVFQFILSIVLISGIVIIYSQLNYIKNKDLGFDQKQKLIFNFYTDDEQNKTPSFINDLKQLPEVKVVSQANNYPGQFIYNDHGVYLEGGNMTTAVDAQNIFTDENFVQATGIKVIDGRDFRLNDSGKVLINETLAKRLGLNEQTAPGTKLFTQFAPDPATSVEIAGVIKDFNYSSLHEDVKPFMLVYDANPSGLSHLIVAVNSKDYKNLLKKIAIIWQKDFSAVPFEYSFLDEEVQNQYESEIALSKIINSFTLMAILISCLGLFGLTAFSAEQKRKEIGIRKVLGASIMGIVQLLSKGFLNLVVIAFIIATPITWLATNKWLQTFAYKVPVSWWMFAIAGLIAVFIALLTVSFQAIKAAIVNPVRSLRTE